MGCREKFVEVQVEVAPIELRPSRPIGPDKSMNVKKIKKK